VQEKVCTKKHTQQKHDDKIPKHFNLNASFLGTKGFQRCPECMKTEKVNQGQG
jgi:hypothetical protein